MEVAQWLPFGFIVGMVGAFVAALRWGRQDAGDAVEQAASNVETAMILRKEAITDAVGLRQTIAEQAIALREQAAALSALRAQILAAGLEPAA